VAAAVGVRRRTEANPGYDGRKRWAAKYEEVSRRDQVSPMHYELGVPLAAFRLCEIELLSSVAEHLQKQSPPAPCLSGSGSVATGKEEDAPELAARHSTPHKGCPHQSR
jgi:hypothetical protein